MPEPRLKATATGTNEYSDQLREYAAERWRRWYRHQVDRPLVLPDGTQVGVFRLTRGRRVLVGREETP